MSDYRALAPRLIGRQSHMAELDACLAAVAQGAGRVVFVAGDAGVGKTRLIREWTQRFAGRPATDLVRGLCYHEDPAVPYGPFVDALRAELRIAGPQTLVQRAGPWLSDLVKLLPELEPLAAPSSHVSDGHFQKRRLFAAIHHALQPIQPQQPRVIVLEDVHWADQTSLDLIRYLAQSIKHDPLLLLASYRTDALHRRHRLTHLITELTRERLYDELRLEPLSRTELAGLLESTLDRALPASFSDVLFARTEGNPFFTEELLRALIAQERIDPLLDLAQQSRNLQHVELPLSLKESILSRTTDLDATTTDVLRYAAVIGRRFEFEGLLRLTGLTEIELVNAIERLVERQLVVEEPDSVEDRYSFRHALTREAIYDDLLGRERRIKHREVVHVLETLYAADLSRVVDQLAYHSVQARELAKAGRYARLAGERAARMYAHREALSQFELALELLEGDDAGDRADLYDRLGHAAYPLGETELATRAWQAARQLFIELGDPQRLAGVERWLSHVAWSRGDAAAAFAHARTGLAALENGPPCTELAMAYSALSHLYMLSDQHQESLEWGRKALHLAEQLGDERVKAHALNNIGTALCDVGDFTRGIAALEQSLEFAQRADLPYDSIRAYHNLGAQLTQQGNYQRARHVLHECVAFAQRFGWEQGPVTISSFTKLILIEIALGNWVEAQQWIDRVLHVTTAPTAHTRLYVLVNQGELWLRQGRVAEAQRVLEELQPEFEQHDDRFAILPLLQSLAYVYLEQNHVARAVALAERAIALAQTATWAVDGCYKLSWVVEVLLRGGQLDLARQHVERMIQSGQTMDTPISQALRIDAQGLLALYEQRFKDADVHFQALAERWHALGLPLDEALARRNRAEALLQTGDPAFREAARQELTTARSLLNALGAASELETTEALARRFNLLRRIVRSGDHRNALTPRERQVLSLVAHGYSNRAISEALVIAEKTAEIHVSNILSKLGFSSRVQAAAYAVEQGWIEPLAA